MANILRKLPWCQNGAILWFTAGDGGERVNFKLGRLRWSSERLVGEMLHYSFPSCWRLQNKTYHPYLDLKYVLNWCFRKKGGLVLKWNIYGLNKVTPTVFKRHFYASADYTYFGVCFTVVLHSLEKSDSLGKHWNTANLKKLTEN